MPLVDSAAALNAPYPLSAAEISRFRDDGFIKLRSIIDAETLAHYGDEIARITLECSRVKDIPLEQRDTYHRAFLQVTNLWRRNERAREFAFGRRLARIAAELLGVDGVRMWHDQALYKEPGGGFTPWHVDQYYWPMASDLSVTAWVPLQAVSLDMGPMCFARGSQRLNIARDLEISDESQRVIEAALRAHRLEEVFEPYELGEVSFHYGWTLHRAGPNTSARPRAVHTIIYMDENMRLAEPRNRHQPSDWEAFSPGTKTGEVMDDELNPVLFSTRST